jgi:hypothetical protein
LAIAVPVGSQVFISTSQLVFFERHKEPETGIDVVRDGRPRQTADTERLLSTYEMSSGNAAALRVPNNYPCWSGR